MNLVQKITFSIAVVVSAFFTLVVVFTPEPARDNNLVLGLIIILILIWAVTITFTWLVGRMAGTNHKKVFITLFIIFLLSNLGLVISDFTAQKKFLSTEKILVFEKTTYYKTVPTALYENNYGDHSAYSVYVSLNFLFAIITLVSLEGLVLLLNKAVKIRFSKIKRFLMVLGLQLLLLVPFAALIVSSEIAANAVLDEARKITKTTMDQLLTPAGRRGFGIDDELPVIAKKIEANEEIPQIIDNDSGFTFNLIISALAINDGKKRSILETIAIPQVLYESNSNALLEKLDKDQLLLPRNILAVTKLNKNLAKETLPILGKKIISKQLKNEAGKKGDPEYKFLTNEEYLKLREQQKKQQGEEILLGIENVKSAIAYYDKYISGAQTSIRELDSEYERYKNYGEGWVRECNVAKGENDQLCKDGRGTLENELSKITAKKDAYSKNIKDAEGYKKEASGDLYLWNKLYEEFTKKPYTTRDEAGTFLSPNKVQILFDEDVETKLQFLDYLNTVVHEQLHYYSSGKQIVKIYLEEAITDYLTEDALGASGIVVRADSGYPQEREVIKSLAKVLPKDEIVSFYFSGNELTVSQFFKERLRISFKDFSRRMELLYYLPLEDYDSRNKLAADIKEQLIDGKQ